MRLLGAANGLPGLVPDGVRLGTYIFSMVCFVIKVAKAVVSFLWWIAIWTFIIGGLIYLND